MKTSRLQIAALILMLLTAGSVVAQQDLPQLTTENPIGPRDVLDIKVLEDPSMTGRATVTDDGKIILNVIGKVDVAGLTAGEVEARLKSLLEANYIQKATVSVQIVEFGSKPISVVGAVLHPGRIGATTNMTLIQALTQAGGLTQGYGRELYILRTARNGLTEQLAVDIEDLMVNGNPDVNVPLAPNDLINVPMDTPITVYVSGEVMKPGKIQFRRSQIPTLLQAMADAGGPTDRAARKAIIKRMVNGKEQRIEVNYRDVIRGKVPDPTLLDNDTIWINESFF